MLLFKRLGLFHVAMLLNLPYARHERLIFLGIKALSEVRAVVGLQVLSTASLLWLLDTWRWVPVACPETSVRTYHCTLRKVPEERGYHLHRDGSLKSRIAFHFWFFEPMENFSFHVFITPLYCAVVFLAGMLGYVCVCVCVLSCLSYE
jgi:hypothetical protein